MILSISTRFARLAWIVIAGTLYAIYLIGFAPDSVRAEVTARHNATSPTEEEMPLVATQAHENAAVELVFTEEDPEILTAQDIAMLTAGIESLEALLNADEPAPTPEEVPAPVKPWSAYKLTELRLLCRDRGVKNAARLKKAQAIAALEALENTL